MNSQLIFIVILYFLIMLITHISLKHRTIKKLDHKIKPKTDQIYEIDDSEAATISDIELDDSELILPEEELIKLDSETPSPEEEMGLIKNFDENKTKAELLNYLDENQTTNRNYRTDFMKNTGDITVQGSNYFTEKSKHDFPSQETNQNKMFSGKRNENYSFDPVPTQETELKDNTRENLLNGELIKKKLFNNVEAFDDFDSSYASLV